MVFPHLSPHLRFDVHAGGLSPMMVSQPLPPPHKAQSTSYRGPTTHSVLSSTQRDDSSTYNCTQSTAHGTGSTVAFIGSMTEKASTLESSQQKRASTGVQPGCCVPAFFCTPPTPQEAEFGQAQQRALHQGRTSSGLRTHPLHVSL